MAPCDRCYHLLEYGQGPTTLYGGFRACLCIRCLNDFDQAFKQTVMWEDILENDAKSHYLTATSNHPGHEPPSLQAFFLLRKATDEVKKLAFIFAEKWVADGKAINN